MDEYMNRQTSMAVSDNFIAFISYSGLQMQYGDSSKQLIAASRIS